MNDPRDERLARYDFPLDRFQLAAIDSLRAGHSVLVAAPTGSGKTVVAEYAIDLAVAAGQRAFYTAPIKALSNQKFNDLRARLGHEAVGLLTGDNSINADAPVVVMTTEVLRNMIYAQAPGLRNLAFVVLDEVHFLQDAYRGPVWEEVIIHLPIDVRLVCLSATVSNTDELAAWISTVRGHTDAVVEDRRPVALDNLYFVGDATAGEQHLLPTLVNGRPNNDAQRLDGEASRGGRRTRRGAHHRARRKLYPPSRLDTVELLEQRHMLPAIYFIFSRNQCDEAARSALSAGVRLTTGEERERIREIVEARLGGLHPADLAVLGYGQFVAQLEAGVAAHHAGMVPPFKEVVEACFVEGLTKVVFATETLAVGINMPAKTVVIDKLTKFTGDHHTSLSPGEYTQLTGRAGRRGLDEQGYAVVPWSPFVPFEQVAALAASRSFQLRSAFRPTYNMAANLVRTYTSDRARHLLNMSFAQFQADRDVVKIEARLERRQQLHAELVAAAESSYGDIADYLRQLPSSNRSRGPVRDDVIELAVSRLEPGDVIELPGALGTEIGVVLTTAVRRNGLRIRVVTESHRTLTLTPEEFRRPPVATHSVVLPDGFAPNSPDYLRQVTSLLDSLPRHPTHLPHSGSMVYQHPVLADPDIDVRLRAAARADQVLREVHDLQRQVQRRNQSISNDFDRVLGVLQRYQYLDAWSLTDRGVTLAKTFHECDLLIVECLHRGLLDGLPPAELAGLASVFVYEHRSPEVPPTPWFPSAAVRRRWASILDVSDELTGVEEDAGLSVHREPDPTFVAVAYAWAAGEGFSEVIESEEITGGDFVRTIKQLIDLLRQIALVATDRATRRAASDASEQLFRGVVSASNAVEADTTRDTMRSESAIEGTVA